MPARSVGLLNPLIMVTHNCEQRLNKHLAPGRIEIHGAGPGPASTGCRKSIQMELSYVLPDKHVRHNHPESDRWYGPFFRVLKRAGLNDIQKANSHERPTIVLKAPNPLDSSNLNRTPDQCYTGIDPTDESTRAMALAFTVDVVRFASAVQPTGMRQAKHFNRAKNVY